MSRIAKQETGSASSHIVIKHTAENDEKSSEDFHGFHRHFAHVFKTIYSNGTIEKYIINFLFADLKLWQIYEQRSKFTSRDETSGVDCI